MTQKMTQLQKAQKELDERIENYYADNEDGGNYEEKMIIAAKVASMFDVKEEDLIF